MMLAGTEAIAARAQPPGKGGNIVSLKNCQIQFVWDGYLLHAFWELWSFATKNVGFEHRYFSGLLFKQSSTTIRYTFTGEKNSRRKVGAGDLGPTPKSALVIHVIIHIIII